MPDRLIMAMSVVPPPMSTTRLPTGASMGRPAPMAAAMASFTRCTSLTPTWLALSITARFSTWVMPGGMPMTILGLTRLSPRITLRMKCEIIWLVASKSAMTPAFIGRMTLSPCGVRPRYFLASAPTATIAPSASSMATTEGSLSTMPCSGRYKRVLAVPRSMARFLARKPKRRLKSMARPVCVGVLRVRARE